VKEDRNQERKKKRMLNRQIAELFGVTEGYVAENLDFIKDIIQSSTGEGEASMILQEDEKASIEDAEGAEDTVYGVKIFEEDDEVAPKEEIVEPKVVEPKAKSKCRCCGFAKKASRVNAEGICKVCYAALATSEPEAPVVVVGRQGRKGRNTVSVVVGGVRVKVQRKVRLES
jgi:hypothetical protein